MNEIHQEDIFKDYLPRIERDPLADFRRAYEAFNEDYDRYDNAGARTEAAINRNEHTLISALGDHPLKDELAEAVASMVPANVFKVCHEILNPKKE
ncbi:hypothetical protein HY771_01780 [Candidatus Uhrbacteria bacterium]|nr:hypothetical protein [Candidatus Uhrbacteria bacterium]